MGTRPDLMFHKSVSSVKTHYILLRVSIQFCFMCLQLYLDAIASVESHMLVIHSFIHSPLVKLLFENNNLMFLKQICHPGMFLKEF